MNHIILYGISNCDTVRKARKWLNTNEIGHMFHDFRKDGINQLPLDQWLKQQGDEKLINRRGTTWRALDDSEKEIKSVEDATQLMREHPALIKRPVLDIDGTIHLGFSESIYAELLKT